MPNSKKKNSIDAFLALSDEEKERQWREFDKEFIADTFRSLTATQRALWERAQKKGRGRPKIGNGAKVISLSVERGLLKRADARAKAAHITRAELVARALEAMLARKAG